MNAQSVACAIKAQRWMLLCLCLAVGVSGVAQNSPDILWMQPGHTGWVTAISFSPDGRYLASASIDGTVKLWRLEDGSMRTIGVHASRVESLAFSPDGAYLVSCSSYSDNTIRLWRVSDGELVRNFRGHSDAAYSVAFSPDGQLIASGGGYADRTIRLWRVSDGAQVGELRGHTGIVYSVAFSPDGAYLASGSEDRTIQVWRLSDGTPIRTFTGHNGPVYSVDFSPDGQYLVSGSGDHTVRLWRLSDLQMRVFSGHSDAVTSVRFSPDGQLIASGGSRTLRLWRVADGQMRLLFQGVWTGFMAIDFSPDGEAVAMGHGTEVSLWNVQTGMRERTLTREAAGTPLAFSLSECWLATGISGRVDFWRVSDGSMLRTWNLRPMANPIAFSRDLSLLAAIEGSFASVWRVSDGARLLENLRGPLEWVMEADFSPDNALIALGGSYLEQPDPDITPTRYGGILVVNLNGAQVYSDLRAHDGSIEKVRFSPNGELLASLGLEGTIVVRRASDGVHLYRLYAPWGDHLRSFAFSPDSRLLASGGDGIARIWHAADGALLQTFAHPGIVLAVEFSPDGQFLVTVCARREDDIREIRFWRLADGALVHRYDRETGARDMHLLFAPNGRFFAYWRDGTLVVARSPLWQVGDANNDGCVDDADLLAVLFEWGQMGGNLTADMNSDCVVDEADLFIVLFHLGSGC